jgi:hypothetical protein
MLPVEKYKQWKTMVVYVTPLFATGEASRVGNSTVLQALRSKCHATPVRQPSQLPVQCNRLEGAQCR